MLFLYIIPRFALTPIHTVGGSLDCEKSSALSIALCAKLGV